jgi:prevent-host-death family protein
VDTFCDQQYDLTMKRIPAAKFKEQCLALLDRVDAEGIVITKRGKPVAKLVPIAAESAELIGRLRGRVKVNGNILGTGLKWHAQP